jgi:hypothetical protein
MNIYKQMCQQIYKDNYRHNNDDNDSSPGCLSSVGVLGCECECECFPGVCWTVFAGSGLSFVSMSSSGTVSIGSASVLSGCFVELTEVCNTNNYEVLNVNKILLKRG